MIQVLEGEDAIAKNRDLMGATDPKKADTGTIRADFADSIDANAVHGSDAAETAAVEIAFFFAGMNVYAAEVPRRRIGMVNLLEFDRDGLGRLSVRAAGREARFARPSSSAGSTSAARATSRR